MLKISRSREGEKEEQSLEGELRKRRKKKTWQICLFSRLPLYQSPVSHLLGLCTNAGLLQVCYCTDLCAELSWFCLCRRFEWKCLCVCCVAGSRGKCIRTEERWFTPEEFVKQEPTLTDGRWKKDILCHGKTLNFLLKVTNGRVPTKSMSIYLFIYCLFVCNF